MAQIPGLPDPSRISVSTNLNAGAPLANPNDFGKARFRDLYNLGQQIQQTAHTAAAWGQKRYEEKAQNESNESLLAINKKIEDEKTRLAKQTGEAAEHTVEEMERVTRNFLGETQKGLTTPRAKELFERKFREYNYNNQLWASRHADSELEKSRVRDLNALNGMINQEVYNDPGRLTSAIERVDAITDKLNENQTPNVQQAERDAARLSLLENAAKSLSANYSPGEAVRMLESLEAEAGEKFPKVVFDRLKKHYGKAARTTDIDRAAMEAVEGNLTLTEIFKKSLEYEDYGEKQQFLQAAGDYSHRKAAEANAEQAAVKETLLNRFAGADYNFAAMQLADRAAIMENPAVFREAMAIRKQFDEWGKFGKDAAPNFAELDALYAKTGEEINAFLASEDGWAKLLLWDAGHNTEEYKRILAKRRGEEGEGKAAGAGGGRVADLNDRIKNNFPAFTGAAYDEKNPEHQRVMSNFRVWLGERLALAQKGREAKPLISEEQDAVFYGLIKDARLGVVKLDRPTYDWRAARQTSPIEEVRLSPSKLDKEDLALNKGEDVILRVNTETGDRVMFGAVDAANPLGLYGGVDWDSQLSAVKPDRVLRAYQRGEMDGLAFNAGDFVAEKIDAKGGKATLVFDSNLKYKGGELVIDQTKAKATAAAMPNSGQAAIAGGAAGAAEPAKKPESADMIAFRVESTVHAIKDTEENIASLKQWLADLEAKPTPFTPWPIKDTKERIARAEKEFDALLKKFQELKLKQWTQP